MALQTHLVKKNGTYYCRYYIPKELQKDIGKKEIWRSLRTGNYSEASQHVKLKASEIILDIAQMMGNRVLDTATIERLGNKHYQWLMSNYENQKLNGYFSKNDKKKFKKEHQKELFELQQTFADEDFSEGELTARTILFGDWRITREEFESPAIKHQFPRLSMRLMRAKLDALTCIVSRETGSFHLSSSSTSVQTSDNIKSITLAEIIERYNNASENKKKKEGLRTKQRNYQRVLLELVDTKKSVFDFTRQDAREVYEDLQKMPLGAFRIKKFRGLSLRQIIEAASKEPDTKKLSPSTVMITCNISETC